MVHGSCTWEKNQQDTSSLAQAQAARAGRLAPFSSLRTARPSMNEYFLPMTTISQYQNGVDTKVVHNSVS